VTVIGVGAGIEHGCVQIRIKIKAKLARGINAEISTFNEAERLITSQRAVGIQRRKVNPITLRAGEVHELVRSIEHYPAVTRREIAERIRTCATCEHISTTATCEHVVARRTTQPVTRAVAMILLASELPVPLMAFLLVSVRFSMCCPARLNATEART